LLTNLTNIINRTNETVLNQDFPKVNIYELSGSVLQEQRLVGFFPLVAFPGGVPADGAPLIAAPLAEIAVSAGVFLYLLLPAGHELYYPMRVFN
jgi:hypothetical protein